MSLRKKSDKQMQHDEQMGSTPFGEVGWVISTGPATPQETDTNRGADDRVRVSDRD